MKVIIIEDEALSAEHLNNLLQKIDNTIEVVGVFESIKESIKALNSEIQYDLIFADIHLADGLSFEIFSKKALKAPIIFTTAYDDYAIKAFKLNSIDYLLKPIAIGDLKRSIEKHESLKQAYSPSEIIIDAIQNLKKTYKSRFMVKKGDVINTVKSEEIECIVSEDGVVFFFTNDSKKYVADHTLDNLEKLLDPKLFFRINRKAIVNINSIIKVSTYFNSRLKITANGLSKDELIVSRERVNEFKIWLGK